LTILIENDIDDIDSTDSVEVRSGEGVNGMSQATSLETSSPEKRHPRAWTPAAKIVVLRPSADELVDVGPLLARIVSALGTNAAARLLGADRAQVSRWGTRKEAVGSEMGRRIVDLHDVLTRILRVYARDAAAMWLVGSEPLLGGARPIDVLALEGAAPVIRAIDGIAEGAFA
jgi:uncharacterized protein (DUF2384 family)